MAGKKHSFYFLIIIAISSLLLFSCGGGDKAIEKSITICWAEWDPANYLMQLVKDFEKETGIAVKSEFIPWGNFQDRVFAEFAAKGDAFDLVIGDSQWLGRGATEGHYVELTDFFAKEIKVQELSPATVVAYAEYPKGSKRYWAFPTEGDAVGWSYRKDLFEAPKEKAAFKKKYGYELVVPKTWEQLRDIAEFFTRPDQNLYGLAIYTQKDYDGITMGIENVLFSWGAELGDPSTFKVDGYINSPEAVDALDFYMKLYKYAPPDHGNAFWQENLDAYKSGLVAMAMNFFAFFPGIVNPNLCEYAEVTGFFSNPSYNGMSFSALGGQGMSIVKYSKKQDLAKKFIKWFAREDVQEKWAELGGYTCNVNVLQSELFLNNTAYNRAFSETMMKVKDFWAVPEYAELLEICQRYFNGAVVANQYSAKDALDLIAKEWEIVFREGGYYK
ncbi:extracellular solute-binding protein [candidate division KSB1 bacterium]|nr:extracellular solute-binding protein [candidate division KSB1 bacterium]